MTLQEKEIAMTKWTQCRNANFVVTKNASRAFEKHEELLNRNFWTNLLYHRNWHFHTMFTKSLRFLSLESQFKKRSKSYKTEPTTQKWNIYFLEIWIDWNDISLGVGLKFMCTYAGSNQSCFRKCGPPQKPYETFGIIRGGIWNEKML